MMRIKPPKADPRSIEQIRAHYEIEHDLAIQLRQVSREERRQLYPMIYDELFRRVPDMPMLTRRADPERQRNVVARQLVLLRRFLKPDHVFLEIGPGDCGLALEVAKMASRVYAVDVSAVIADGIAQPQNFTFLISDGVTIPVPPGSVDVAYSLSLMEHLHPDDAVEHLRNVYATLKPNGVYICLTPNRLNGPHDISKYFDTVATGLHLKEYTNLDLATAYRHAGFQKVRPLIGPRDFCFIAPLTLVAWFEAWLPWLPEPLSWRIASWLPMKLILGVKLVGWK